MKDLYDLSLTSMALAFALLIIPLLIYYYLNIKGMTKKLIISATRMTVQLVLMGIYLKYLFQYNNSIINILWLLVMIIAATFSAVNNSNLNKKIFILPVLAAYSISIYITILYFNFFVISVQNIFSAKYLIVIGGMLLGNSLRGVIISISSFYKEIINDKNRYYYRLALTGNFFDSTLPYFRKAIVLALSPNIATMATMGLVSIPGMMTGQILGGASPMVAVKYQIAIVIAIFVSTNISIVLAIFFTWRYTFNKNGIIVKKIINKKN